MPTGSFATPVTRAAARRIRDSPAGVAPARMPRGGTRIRTVVPGSYGDRCPHANLMILAIGLTRRLVTTVFFADDPDAVRDPVLDCVKDAAARKRLFAKRENAGEYRFDLILRGERGEGETPFFLD